ncbi:hypothetical protein BDV18DRAFT_110085 [Aspergillus unguis]
MVLRLGELGRRTCPFPTGHHRACHVKRVRLDTIRVPREWSSIACYMLGRSRGFLGPWLSLSSLTALFYAEKLSIALKYIADLCKVKKMSMAEHY